MREPVHDAYQPSAPPAAALRATIDAYSEELAARHSQLLDDLAIYQDKLHDLVELDPLDFTGLQHLYTTHVNQIEKLLCEFDAVEG